MNSRCRRASCVRCGMTFRPAAWLAAACIAIASFAAHAQSLPGGFTLGMTVPQLQQAEPALRRVPHPARLAGGLVGSWSGHAIDVAGVALTPTFFFAEGQLRRVEYLARDGGPAAFAALLAWARGMWGEELAANAPEGAYASWEREDTQVYLQRAGAARGEQVRLVTKQRVLKDAGEL